MTAILVNSETATFWLCLQMW